MRLIIGLACAVALAACTAGEGPAPSEEGSMEPRQSLHPESIAPSGLERELTGTLGADSVEGGCAYLESAQGTKYEVIYPDGWRVQASPLQLTDPDGQVVATGGEPVTVRGAEARDMGSICQIGPIFLATEVVSVE